LGGGNDTGGGLFGASIAPNALIAEVGGGGAGFNIFNPFGPGGWLIGNGLDAQAGCVGAACPCGSGRILFGDGGAGLDGGHGGTGGLFCGTGGAGGQGLAGATGGAGGAGGLFFGTGGAGGQGGTGTNGAGGGDKGTDGGQGGVGGAGGGGAPSA
jgi:hypothetical protein